MVLCVKPLLLLTVLSGPVEMEAGKSAEDLAGGMSVFDAGKPEVVSSLPPKKRPKPSGSDTDYSEEEFNDDPNVDSGTPPVNPFNQPEETPQSLNIIVFGYDSCGKSQHIRKKYHCKDVQPDGSDTHAGEMWIQSWAPSLSGHRDYIDGIQYINMMETKNVGRPGDNEKLTESVKFLEQFIDGRHKMYVDSPDVDQRIHAVFLFLVPDEQNSYLNLVEAVLLGIGRKTNVCMGLYITQTPHMAEFAAHKNAVKELSRRLGQNYFFVDKHLLLLENSDRIYENRKCFASMRQTFHSFFVEKLTAAPKYADEVLLELYKDIEMAVFNAEKRFLNAIPENRNGQLPKNE